MEQRTTATDLLHQAARILLAGQQRGPLQGRPQLQRARQRQALARLLQQHRCSNRQAEANEWVIHNSHSIYLQIMPQLRCTHQHQLLAHLRQQHRCGMTQQRHCSVFHWMPRCADERWGTFPLASHT